MAIQFMDDFKTYGGDGSHMLDGLPWSGLYASLVTDPDPGSSGYVLRVENYAKLALPTPKKQVGIGNRLYMSALPIAYSRSPQLSYCDSGNSILYYFIVAPNGSLEFRKGDDTLVETTTIPVLAPHSWFHIETFVDSETGAYEARIEGITVLSGTTTLDNINFGIVQWNSQGISIEFFIKDFILWDTTGTVNNDFIGTCTIYNLAVNSDVSSGWTKSAGTSDYALLDDGDGTLVDDTDYISAGASPLPAASIMGMVDLPSTVVTVKAIQPVVRAKKTDGGDASLVTSLISGSSTADGTTKAVTTAFKYWFDVIELDPATGTPWSPLSANAAQIKINRTV